MSANRKNAFAAGYACACAGLARDHRETDLAKFPLDDSGIPLRDFEQCGVDEYDLAEVRKLFAST
ncbi:hypothetical protein ACWX0K_10795 [Nitrobacteraceae bacterium UC4446_H13]